MRLTSSRSSRSTLQPLKLSLIGKTVERGQVVLSMHDLRDFTHDRHRTVDDAPYGGGPGMVSESAAVGWALDTTVLTDESTLIVPTPPGRRSPRVRPRSWLSGRIWCSRAAAMKALMLASWSISRSRVEVREISIGDYVLAGGEAATLVMCEAIGRLLPGCWAIHSVRSMTRSAAPTTCWRALCTHGRRSGGDYRFRRFFCPATMNASASGGKSVPGKEPRNARDRRLFVPSSTSVCQTEGFRVPPATGATRRSQR